ncbi:hypothetical protein HGM15179_014277 [Zosterops borbonicus]|uniref:Uncharacterized protein n=1 Tax=Zosterops borbonicus TaxID=364589 RepID=A0A8K1G759_9PASS|nr:hypothetical protein HGM15179_014277 [Zosterops borbonicus]
MKTSNSKKEKHRSEKRMMERRWKHAKRKNLLVEHELSTQLDIFMGYQVVIKESDSLCLTQDSGQVEIEKVMEYWHKLPKEVIDAPSLGTFKARLDGILSNLILLKISLPVAASFLQAVLWGETGKWKDGIIATLKHLIDKLDSTMLKTLEIRLGKLNKPPVSLSFQVVSEVPVISIEMSMSAMWFMLFGFMSLAKFIDGGPRGSHCPELEDHGCDNNKLSLDPELVWDLLLQLDPCKSMSPNKINPRILAELTDIIMRFLSGIFEWSWQSGEVPADWKLPYGVPVFRKDKENDPITGSCTGHKGL